MYVCVCVCFCMCVYVWTRIYLVYYEFLLGIFSTQVLCEYLVLLSLTLCVQCTFVWLANYLSLTHSRRQLCVSLSSEFHIWWYHVASYKSSRVRSFSPQKSENDAINVSLGIRANYLTFTSMPLFSWSFMFSMWPLEPYHSSLNFRKYLCFLLFSLQTKILSLRNSLCLPCHLCLISSWPFFQIACHTHIPELSKLRIGIFSWWL